MSVLEETIRANISALRGGMSSDATPDLELFVPTLRQWLHDECAPTATKLRNALGECDLVVEQVVKYKDSGLDKIADIFRNYEKFVKTECRDIDLIVRRHLGNHLAIILLEFGKPDDALSNIHEIQGLEYLTVSGKDNDEVAEIIRPILTTTRELLGDAWEMKCDSSKALEWRRKSGICTHRGCPSRSDVNPPNVEPCHRCKSALYCGKACKKKDWVLRHNNLCLAFLEAVSTESLLPSTAQKTTEAIPDGSTKASTKAPTKVLTKMTKKTIIKTTKKTILKTTKKKFKKVKRCFMS